MTFTMGLAYLIYEKLTESRLLLVAYLVILLASLGLYYVLRGRHWFAKHLTYRALAETMRAKFYLRLAGVDHRVDAAEVLALSGIDRFHGFGWISCVLKGVEVPDVRAETEPGPGLAPLALRRAGLDREPAPLFHGQGRAPGAQQPPHQAAAQHAVRRHPAGDHDPVPVRRCHGRRRDRHPGMPLKNMLTFCMGFLAVLLGVWELHQDKMATRELLWQYRNQLVILRVRKMQLARIATPSRRNEVLAELGKDSLMESYLWTIHRYHREHEPPAGA